MAFAVPSESIRAWSFRRRITEDAIGWSCPPATISVFDVTTPAVAKLINDNKAALALHHAPKVAIVQKEAAQ